MKLLSIDIGIKNMSFCLFDMLSNDSMDSLKILEWNNVDLTEQTNTKCIEVDKKGICNKPAKFMKDGNCYCLKHSKKQPFIHVTSELKPSYLAKQKIPGLQDIANKYKLTYEMPLKKSNLLAIINEFVKNNCYTNIVTCSSGKMDLVTIGRNIQHKLDEILKHHLDSIDHIVIENQIGPIASKMKTVQGMVSQYFIMKNNFVNIEFVSAINKLKDHLPSNTGDVNMAVKMDYKKRKQLGIQTCLNIIGTDHRFNNWEDFVAKHKKKDDLSDCFLQGLWYIKHKLT